MHREEQRVVGVDLPAKGEFARVAGGVTTVGITAGCVRAFGSDVSELTGIWVTGIWLTGREIASGVAGGILSDTAAGLIASTGGAAVGTAGLLTGGVEAF